MIKRLQQNIFYNSFIGIIPKLTEIIPDSSMSIESYDALRRSVFTFQKDEYLSNDVLKSAFFLWQRIKILDMITL